MARTAVVAGTATAVSGGVSRHQQARAEEAQSQAYQQQQQQAAMQAAAQQAAQQQAAAQAAAPATAADITSRLKDLADLKTAGAITDEEFTAAKAKLLGM
jgi:hypothetical protein